MFLLAQLTFSEGKNHANIVFCTHNSSCFRENMNNKLHICILYYLQGNAKQSETILVARC